jgi:hypothetical protein
MGKKISKIVDSDGNVVHQRCLADDMDAVNSVGDECMFCGASSHPALFNVLYEHNGGLVTVCYDCLEPKLAHVADLYLDYLNANEETRNAKSKHGRVNVTKNGG